MTTPLQRQKLLYAVFLYCVWIPIDQVRSKREKGGFHCHTVCGKAHDTRVTKRQGMNVFMLCVSPRLEESEPYISYSTSFAGVCAGRVVERHQRHQCRQRLRRHKPGVSCVPARWGQRDGCVRA